MPFRSRLLRTAHASFTAHLPGISSGLMWTMQIGTVASLWSKPESWI